MSANKVQKSTRCKSCQRELSNCTCLVCSSTDCSELFKAEEAGEGKKQNCSACRKRTGQFVQVRGKCGKCFQVHSCKAAKSECMCTKNKRLARCRNHCGRILAVRDWLEGGKPTSSCLGCPGEEPVTTTCSTDGSEVPFLSLVCLTCSETIDACSCTSKPTGSGLCKAAPSRKRAHRPAGPVCPDCKMPVPEKIDAQGRYYCKTCDKQKRRKVCGSCHADLKACTCRLSLEHVCPEEGCQGRIPHLEKQDEKGRVTCRVCGERFSFSKLACGLCWEEKREKLPLYQCHCIVGAAA